ncbi:MAG: efflux RND transporter permease subunit [Proteobacteria bacterium]|nr:efflux RND transporter permease subunit [Pseudomonadota bacterium]
MIRALIDLSLKNHFLVFLATAFILAAGIFTLTRLPLDAIPDLSDVQVIVFTEYPGQSPQTVEDQVTYPLTSAMLSVPGATVVRGYSFFGLSFVYIIFEDGTDMYWARSRVLEYLNYVSTSLPSGVAPALGPDATGVGWIYEYALVDRTGQHDLAELRSIQDWYLRYGLQTVPGVAEVASVGGYVKQYQVEVDPNALLFYKIPLSKIKMAIMRSNQDVGGRLVEIAEREYMVRGLGYIQSLEDIEVIPIGATPEGTPLYLRDVADIKLGPDLRRGLVELNGEGEVAGGVIIMRFGENALEVIRAVRERLDELRAGLPEGVKIIPTYDRGDLIERAVENLSFKLLEEFIVVSIVIMLFLMHMRSALVIILSLPVGILVSFIIMNTQGINANIMSLGGIAITIGIMVDGAIVMIENAHKRLGQARKAKGGGELSPQEHFHEISTACKEVGPALFFSLLIITVSFVVIFALQGQEGRLFKPMAFTSTYALAASAVLAVTLVPVLMLYLVKGKIMPEEKNPINRFILKLHTPALKFAVKRPLLTFLVALVLIGSSFYPLARTGSEFMPPLDEGDILYMPTMFPGISITKGKQILQQTDRILKTFPEVRTVFGKIGRVQSATDPAPLSMIETVVRLKPKEDWPDPSKTTFELMREMDEAIRFPGVANAWTMPIKTRIDMLSTGIKTPVGIKVSGPDLEVLQGLGEDIEGALNKLPDTLSVFSDRTVGGSYLDIDIDREAAARYGLTIMDVGDVIQSAIGGMNITQTIEGRERYPVNLRYARELRDSPEEIGRLLIPTPTGVQIPLAQVASIELKSGPPAIKREGAVPNAWVYIDIKTSDIGGYVAEAKALLEQEIEMPPGYTLTWSGQYEYMERAAKRLQLIIPVTLAMIFLLLYFNFRNVLSPLVVMFTVPLGLAGGLWLVYWLGYNFSVAVAVGFIALAGISAEIGVLVLTFINQEIKARLEKKAGGRLTKEEIWGAVFTGTSERVRPVTMTCVAILAGLIPVMVTSGTGSDVMRRIAAPMVGGTVSVFILSLLVLPVVYGSVLILKERIAAKVSKGG